MRAPAPALLAAVRASEPLPRHCYACGQVVPVRYATFRCSECGKHCAVTVKRGRRRLTCSPKCYRARTRRLERAAFGREGRP